MPLSRLLAGFIGLTLALLGAGCVGPAYAPGPYKAAQDRFGAIELPAAGQTVAVCPVIDRLTPENRKRLKPVFTPWTYVTEAFEAELRASGLKPVRAAFAFGPSFAELQKAIREQPADETARKVYLGTELLFLNSSMWILDAELISPKGEVLFAKRGLSSVWGNATIDEQQVIHMVLRQILADSRFKAALQ